MEMQEVHVVFMPVDVHSAAHGSRSNIDFQVTSNIFCEAIAAMPCMDSDLLEGSGQSQLKTF